MKYAQIRLSRFNEHGIMASICDMDDVDEVNLVINKRTNSPKTICEMAAKRLRILAEKFDALAVADDPFKIKTQEAITNAMETAGAAASHDKPLAWVSLETARGDQQGRVTKHLSDREDG